MRRLLVAFAFAFVACRKTPHVVDPARLHVLAFTPREKTTDSKPPLTFRFSAPVVGDPEVGHPVDKVPVTIEPSVGLSAYWSDRETLVVTPKEPLAKSTRYRVELTGDVVGKQHEQFAFNASPLEYLSMKGLDEKHAAPDVLVSFELNQAVETSDAVAHCAIMHGESHVGLVADKGDDGAPHTIVSMRPASALSSDTDYALGCEGLTVPGGNLGLGKEPLATFRTFGALTHVQHKPQGQDVAPNDAGLEVQMSNPISDEEFQKHVHIEPAVKGIDGGYVRNSDTTYAVTLNLATETDYKVTVDGELADRFGQKLGQPVEWAFHTGDATPKVSLKTGIYAVEPAAEGYPVWTRNVGKFSVECTAVERKQIVPLLTSELDYDPWYDASKPGDDLWKKLAPHTTTTKLTTHAEKNKWKLTSLDLPKTCGGKSGLYLADVDAEEAREVNKWRAGWQKRRVLANVTRLGLLLKAGDASGLVWVVGIDDGKPVAGASVELFSPKGGSVFKGVTDASGMLKLPGTATLLKGAAKKTDDEEDEYSYRARRLIAIAEKDGDLAVVDGNWQNGIQVWNFGVESEQSGGASHVRGFIQSDRGIYRPGETAHFKGVVRTIDIGKAARVPTGKVELTVTDARDAEVQHATLPLSRFGGFWIDLPVPAEANLGDWTVTAIIDGQTFREKFLVQEFRKQEVEIRGDGGEVPHGKRVPFKMNASYLFGAPLADGKVDWSVQKRRHYMMFPKYPQFVVGSYDDDEMPYWYRGEAPSDFVADGEVQTDKHGDLKFAAELEEAPKDTTDYIAHVSVKDPSEQVTTKDVVVTMHPSDFYLAMHANEFVQAVEMPFAVNLVALKPDGTPVSTTAKLSWTLVKYDCGYRSWDTCKPHKTTEWTRDVKLDAGGVSTERIRPEKPGTYEVAIVAKDAHGHDVRTATDIYVIGKGQAFWSGDESDRMTLIASKQSYEPGETAKLVARANFPSATALVTLERNGILDANVQPFSAAGGFSIPVKAEHAPNVFASVALFQGRTGDGDEKRPRFKMGVVNLAVSAESNRLKVSIDTDKKEYRPGDPVHATVKVLDGAGKPVSAELALSVADEGVLQVVAFKTPDPMAAFYRPWGLGVDTGTTLNRIARIADPNAGDADEGGDSGGPKGKVRSKFLSSAFWSPALVTDEQGLAKVDFSLPDNLTAFRLMVAAADKATRFGSAEARITVKKPLLITPALPRFVTTGDEVSVGVVVHNYTGQAGTVTLDAKARGMKLASTHATVQLKADASATVKFPAKVELAKDATLTFSATLGSEKDAVEITLPIDRGLVYEKTLVHRGEVTGHAETKVAWNKDDVLPASSLRITIDATGMAQLSGGLRELIEYPYGCLEQTLSKLIPLLKVKELADTLDLPELRGERLRSFIAAGVTKIGRHQHDDGHFSLWTSGKTEPQLTAYALWGLSEAKRAGVKVDKKVVDKGLAALRDWASSPAATVDIGNYGTLAMSADVFAEMGKADPALNAKLFDARDQLPRYGLGFLLSALKASKAAAAQITKVEAELLAAATVKGNALVIAETGASRTLLEEYFSSDVRSTAIALRALVAADPKNAANGKLAAGLVDAQGKTDRWESTQDNIYALVALAAFAKQRAAIQVEATVTLAGKTIAKKSKAQRVLSVELPLDKLEPGAFAVDAQGAFVSATLVRARRDDGNKAVSQGFSLTRVYLDAVSGDVIESAKPGQLVKVRLRVRTAEAHQRVAVVDPLPAGLEPLPPTRGADDDSGSDEYRFDPWIQREEHDDRVQGFADRISAGDLDFQYLARATTAGSFTAAPATVEEMYHPEVRARTVARRMVVGK